MATGSYSDGTQPFDAGFGDATGPADRITDQGFADPTGASVDTPDTAGDPTGVFTDRDAGFAGSPPTDSISYTTPAGDPFGDALAASPEPWDDPSSSPSPDRDGDQSQTRAAPADQSPAGRPSRRSPDSARVAAPATGTDASAPANPRGTSTAPAEGSGSAERSAQTGPVQLGPVPSGPPTNQPRINQPRTAPARPAGPPPAASGKPKPSRQPSSPMTLDELTKRPSMRRRGQERRPRPVRQQRPSPMARFPTEPGRPEPAANARGSERQNKAARPLVPIIIFAIVLVVAFVRGCDSSKNHSQGQLNSPTKSVAATQQSTENGGVAGLP
jgi:hypothetical protein